MKDGSLSNIYIGIALADLCRVIGTVREARETPLQGAGGRALPRGDGRAADDTQTSLCRKPLTPDMSASAPLWSHPAAHEQDGEFAAARASFAVGVERGDRALGA